MVTRYFSETCSNTTKRKRQPSFFPPSDHCLREIWKAKVITSRSKLTGPAYSIDWVCTATTVRGDVRVVYYNACTRVVDSSGVQTSFLATKFRCLCLRHDVQCATEYTHFRGSNMQTNTAQKVFLLLCRIKQM